MVVKFYNLIILDKNFKQHNLLPLNYRQQMCTPNLKDLRAIVIHQELNQYLTDSETCKTLDPENLKLSESTNYYNAVHLVDNNSDNSIQIESIYYTHMHMYLYMNYISFLANNIAVEVTVLRFQNNFPKLIVLVYRQFV